MKTTLHPLVALAAALLPVFASGETGPSRLTLSGTVYDSTHGVIVGAAATLEPIGPGGVRLQASTDAAGMFAIAGVDPALRYRLTVRARGFAAHVSEVAPSAGRSIDVTLQPQGLAEEVSVEATAYLPASDASATRTDTPLAEIPQAISIVTSAQIEERDAQTIQEVVGYAAGVRAEPYGLDNRNDWFILRGSSDTVTVVDGLRAPLVGYWGGRQEPFAFEQVDVLRGPSSILVGQSAPGGVLNMVSKQPRATAAREVALQFGNRRQVEASADLTGPVGSRGDLLYRLFGLVRGADGQVDYANDDRQFGGGALTFRPDGRTWMTGYANYLREESQSSVGFFPWTGMLLPAPYGTIAPERFLSEPDWDTYVVGRWRLGYQLSRELGKSWTVRHQLRYDTLDGDMRSMYSNFWEGFLEDQRSVNRTWYATDYSGHTTSLDLLAEGRLEWGATRHTLLAGMDGGWLWDGTRFLDGAATPLDLYAPVYGNWEPPTLDYGPRQPTATRQLGFFVQDQAKIDGRLVVVAGLRRDAVKTEVEGSPEAGSDDGAWSSRLGAVVLAGPVSPYASYSESFEAVGGADVYGTPYEPKRGRQVELGLRYSPASRVNVSLAAYHLNETNRLTPDPDNPVNQVQGGKVRVRGLELEATASLDAWDFTASYTFTDGKVVESSDPADPYLGKHLLSIPENAFSLWCVRKERLGAFHLRLGGGVRYVGRTWDGQDLLATPANTLVDATVAVTHERWRVAVNATNLLDDVYIATCIDRGDCWYGSRRRVTGSLGYRF